MTGGAVVALEPHHGRTGEIVFEAQDVVDLRPAPAIDRLVVVAHAGDVAVPLRQKAQPEILGDVGVLVLVDQDVAEALLVIRQHVRVLAPQLEAEQQQIAEISGVQGQEPGLIGGVERAALAEGEGPRLAGGTCSGRRPRFFHPSMAEDRAAAALLGGQRCRRRCVWSTDDLLHQAQLVVHPQDGEIRFQPTISACRRRILVPMEWKVPSQGIPSPAGPMRAPIRCFISRAALLVKVTDRMS